MTRKIRLGILFGGRSCEHEISVRSAHSMLAAVDTSKYDVSMIGISKSGEWLLAENARTLLESGSVGSDVNLPQVALDHQGAASFTLTTGKSSTHNSATRLDVVFPLLHGPYGEDGTMQGLLELASIAYVGSGVLGSAASMDKDIAKKIFAAQGIPQSDYLSFKRNQWQKNTSDMLAAIKKSLNYPLFVKPANLGSSVGISKTNDDESLQRAIDFAFEFDLKVVVEQGFEDCREVECAVLGNDEPMASVVGEIIPNADFYDYDTKYVNDNSELVIPACISERQIKKIQTLSLMAFKAVDAAGLARVDFFAHKNGEDVYLNEINTMPGFTPISMYPKLWQASGIEYGELINRLIELAIQRHTDRAGLKTSI